MKIAFRSFPTLSRSCLAAACVLFTQSAVSQENAPLSERLESGIGAAQERVEANEPGCLSPKINVVTDRPTASSAAETTQCGVLEVLTGPERIWQGRGAHQDDIAPSLQFGLTPNLDLHYARATFFRLGGNPGPLSGSGDTFAGARYKFNKQGKALPSFGAFYTVKLPTGSPSEGFGTGRYDHTLAFIVSKDLPKAVHVDFNVAPQLIGRPDAAGFDKNAQLVLFTYAPSWRHLTFGVGSYGFTKLNDTTPAWSAGAVALDWQAAPRLIFDAGFDEGLTSGAPRKRISFGLTYAPANIYALVRGPRERTH